VQEQPDNSGSYISAMKMLPKGFIVDVNAEIQIHAASPTGLPFSTGPFGHFSLMVYEQSLNGSSTIRSPLLPVVIPTSGVPLGPAASWASGIFTTQATGAGAPTQPSNGTNMLIVVLENYPPHQDSIDTNEAIIGVTVAIKRA